MLVFHTKAKIVIMNHAPLRSQFTLWLSCKYSSFYFSDMNGINIKALKLSVNATF